MRYGRIRMAGAVAGLAMLAIGLPAVPARAAGDQVRGVSVSVAGACAVRTDGTAWCWGDNTKHQIGDGTSDPRPTPVQVQRAGGGPLVGVTRLSRNGGDHTCAIKRDRTIRCWGQNDSGELGDGTADPRLHPVATIVGSSGQPIGGVTSVVLGADHGCALRANRTVWCWGFNGSGRLGDGTTDERHAAVPVRTAARVLRGATAIAAGAFHSCAVLADTTVRCWGANTRGQLGDGTTDERHTAVRVRLAGGRLLRGVVDIGAGYTQTCALMAGGTVRCWGGNDDGELGDGTTDERHHPVRVRRGSGFLGGVRALSVGDGGACASTTTGRALCWGDNETGAIGDGTLDDRHSARLVVTRSGAFTRVRRVATQSGHTCAIRTDTSLWCWGYNGDGQLGTGGPDPIYRTPQRVAFP